MTVLEIITLLKIDFMFLQVNTILIKSLTGRLLKISERQRVLSVSRSGMGGGMGVGCVGIVSVESWGGDNGVALLDMVVGR